MEKEVGDITIDEVIESLAKIVEDSRTLRPDELTIKDLLQKIPTIKKSAIGYFLNDLVREGVLTTREVSVCGKHTIAYSPADGYSWMEILQKIK